MVKLALIKLDTGAEVTAFCLLTNCIKNAQPQCRSPHSYCMGQVAIQSKYWDYSWKPLNTKTKSSLQTVFVVKDLKINLLGLPAITALKLAARINDITDYHAMIEGSFPAVFKGLGNRKEPYAIRLFLYVQPYAFHVSRNVPLQLRDKVCTCRAQQNGVYWSHY